MPTAVVTGANSGVGHKFAEKLINEGYTVYATDIVIGEALSGLKTEHKHHLDVSSPASITTFAQEFGDQPLDILLNVAGVFIPRPQDTLETISQDALNRIFQINTFGPLLLTQALLPNLLSAASLFSSSSPSSSRLPPRIGNVSSRVGSIADNSTSGSYAYRASKTALNSFSKCMALDLKDKGVVVVILHPGMVRTNMDAGQAGAKETVEPEVAVEGLWEVLRGKGIEETGRFWHRDGYELPW